MSSAEMRPEAGLKFLAALAVDEPGDLQASMDAFMPPGDPEAFIVGVVCLLNVAGAMLSTVDGVVAPWGFEMIHPLGEASIPEEQRWAARFVIACMNGDHASAFDLWYLPASREVQEKQAEALSTLVFPLLRKTVRGFVAAGKQLDEAALQPWTAEVDR